MAITLNLSRLGPELAPKRPSRTRQVRPTVHRVRCVGQAAGLVA